MWTETIIFMLLTSQLCIAKINIYEDTHFKGETIEIEVEYNRECHNVPTGWEDRASGVNSHGMCIELYSEWNCTGDTIRLFPGSFTHWFLAAWDFNDILKSVQSCEKQINDNNYITEGDSVAFYEDPNRKGPLFNINVNSCRNLPPNWRKRASSLVSFTRCYIFYSELNCDGRSLMVPSNSTFTVNNLADWNFDRIISSVNNCPSDTSFVDEIYSATRLPAKDNETLTEVNGIGNTTNSQTTANASEGFTKETVITLFVTFALFLLTISGLIFFYIYFRKRTAATTDNATPIEEARREFLCQKYIDHFLKGNSLAFDQISLESVDTICRATNLSYDAETFEIPLECINIDTTRLLGSGEFGIVSKAIVTSSQYPEPIHVAVKTLKAGADPEYIKAILDELKIMMYLQRQRSHSSQNNDNRNPYIIHLIGACTQKIYQLQPYIILEFCALGSLDVYLKSQRNAFMNLVKDGQLSCPKSFSSCSNIGSINTLNLLQWSRNIADGMAFLASNKVIHGDLAARNILLDCNLVTKISDFGLSRRLYQYIQYVKTKQAPLPWRWMAIESLQDLTFSEKSDVWAYGVTLWEIFSLAEMPYPGVVYGSEFLTQLKDGYRMSMPAYAPSNVYEVMSKCWLENPDERPSFAEIRKCLTAILEENSAPIYSTLSCSSSSNLLA